jgi:cytochrome c peroxidase
MRLYYYIIPFFCGVILFLTRCTADKVYTDPLKIDYKLKDAIRQVSPDGTVDFYKLPYEGDFAQIPQDPANPLNAAKVSLGMYLFYETGIGLDPVYETGKQTYS